MFNLSYSVPYEGEVLTLKLKKDPTYYGLGYYEDVDGNIWDVRCAFGNNGKPIVNAAPIDHCSPLYSTAIDGINDSGFQTYTFLPFYLEVINDGNKEV